MNRKNPDTGIKNLITKRVEFSASHRYWNNNWSEEKNREVFGKYSYEHGHNFLLEVTFEGVVDGDTGMIINLFDIKHILNTVLKDFDHRNLNNENENFKALIPTPENMASVFWTLIEGEINIRNIQCKLYNVRLYETPELYVDYRRY